MTSPLLKVEERPESAPGRQTPAPPLKNGSEKNCVGNDYIGFGKEVKRIFKITEQGSEVQ
jgi:hypothetical protein